jgi:hypothetical protein
MLIRPLLILGAAVAALALQPSTEVAAYDGAWCLKARVGRAVSEICRFATFEACNRERQLYGTTSFCVQSQYWTAQTEPRRRKIKKRKR